ncbi:efflux RND transporter permease subunit [Maribellus mangrovi]|uniref:efflux RND transporter permease subunit n=1 Tax=Maribellus mangrovi TaxID=3133146 RepID=UPI0030EEB24F
MEIFSKFVLKFRWFITVFVIVTTVFLGLQIPKIKINSDVVSSLPNDDKDVVLLKRIGEQFGGNRLGMVILDSEDIFTTEVLQDVKRITDSIAQIPNISSVTSLTNTVSIRETQEGIEIGNLVDEDILPETAQELNALREQVLSNEMFRGTIVSDDGTATIIIFTLSDEADIQEVAYMVEQKTQGMNLREQIFYAGSPMLITSIARLISEDMALLFPVALVVIALVLFLSFRSFNGVFMPLLVSIISVIWVIGTMSLLGFEMSMVSNNIPIILLAVGSAYAIHVIHWIDHIRKFNPEQAISVALKSVVMPVILAALTTMAGFLSFIFGAYLRMIRDFGLFTALGTFFAVFLSLVFVPAIASFYTKIKIKETPKKIFLNTQIHNFLLDILKKVLIRSPKQILWIWIVLVLAAVTGITMIQRNVDIRNYFKKENPTRIAEDIMTEKFGGTKPVFVHFEGDILDPTVLKTMVRMEEYMKKDPNIISTQSVADLVIAINGAFGEGEKIPDEKEIVEQLWFLLDGNENIQKFVSPELDEAVIISKFVSSDNEAKEIFANYMQKFIDENSDDDCKIQITGMPFIDVKMDRSLINSQIGSLLIAIFFVILIVGIVLRSLVSGIFAALPIIASIIILFGFMGFTKIPLNIGTVLVASVAVGIGIDYSIHVITHFKKAINNGETISEAVNETIEISGRAIIINVFSVSAGFLVLLFSEMVPLEYFGLLVSLSMVGSGLGAMTLLPSILVISNRKGNKIVTNRKSS